MLLWLPPTPSVGNEVTIGLISSHLVGHCCFSLVAFFGVLAGGTGVAISNVKTMGPTVIIVAVESGGSVAFGRSGASWFASRLVGWLLDGCQCRSLLGLRCHCSLKLGQFLIEGSQLELVGS